MTTEKFDLKEEINKAAEMMDNIIEDRSVPRNIRAAVETAKGKLLNEAEELSLRISTAVYDLDDISNDINMPSHARTLLWELISQLEFIRETSKEKT